MARRTEFKVANLYNPAFKVLWTLARSQAPGSPAANRTSLLSRIVEWYALAMETGAAPLNLFSMDVENEILHARRRWEIREDFDRKLMLYRRGDTVDMPAPTGEPRAPIPGTTLSERVDLIMEEDRQRAKAIAEFSANKKAIEEKDQRVRDADIAARKAGLKLAPPEWLALLG